MSARDAGRADGLLEATRGIPPVPFSCAKEGRVKDANDMVRSTSFIIGVNLGVLILSWSVNSMGIASHKKMEERINWPICRRIDTRTLPNKAVMVSGVEP